MGKIPIKEGSPTLEPCVRVAGWRGKAARCLSQLHNPFFRFFRAPNLEEWCFLSTVDAFFHPLRLVVYPTVGTNNCTSQGGIKVTGTLSTDRYE